MLTYLVVYCCLHSCFLYRGERNATSKNTLLSMTVKSWSESFTVDFSSTRLNARSVGELLVVSFLMNYFMSPGA